MYTPALAFLLADADTQSTGDVIIACLVLMGMVFALWGAVTWVRRWIKRPDELPVGGFTLGTLRDLHRNGKMTTEEFERAKAMIIAVAKKASEKKDPHLSRADLNIR